MERRIWTKRIGVVAAGLGAVVAVVALGGAAAAAQGRRWHDPAQMGAMIGRRLDRMLDEVNATPDQRQKITAIKDRLLAKHQALRDARVATRQELLAQWDSATPDMTKVHARIDERAKEMTAFAHDAADAMNEVHGILTPEQRAKVVQLWKSHRHGPGPGPGPGPGAGAPPPPPPAQGQ